MATQPLFPGSRAIMLEADRSVAFHCSCIVAATRRSFQLRNDATFCSRNVVSRRNPPFFPVAVHETRGGSDPSPRTPVATPLSRGPHFATARSNNKKAKGFARRRPAAAGGCGAARPAGLGPAETPPSPSMPTSSTARNASAHSARTCADLLRAPLPWLGSGAPASPRLGFPGEISLSAAAAARARKQRPPTHRSPAMSPMPDQPRDQVSHD